MGTSKVSVDLNLRTFDIEVPDENVGHVLELLGHLFDKLPPKVEVPQAPDAAPNDDHGDGEAQVAPEENSKQKRKRGTSKSGAKVRAPELIDLGLTVEQRRDLQSFYAEKEPRGQNDQVAVLGVKLKEFTQRSEFSADEIHSAFKVVAKPTPKNLIAVFGNMKRDGKAGYSDNKLVVNAFTEDHVAYHMTKVAKD